MKKTFFTLAALFASAVLFFSSCGQYVEDHGEKILTVGNITLHATYQGYGKDSDGKEDVMVHYYESGDLSTFIDYGSETENANPYRIKTSNQGADAKNNNIIKMELTFKTQTIESVLINIELGGETRTSQFYMQPYLDDKETGSKTTLSGGKKTVAVNAEINRILIYIDAPKFSSSGEKSTGTFKFNCCLLQAFNDLYVLRTRLFALATCYAVRSFTAFGYDFNIGIRIIRIHCLENVRNLYLLRTSFGTVTAGGAGYHIASCDYLTRLRDNMLFLE